MFTLETENPEIFIQIINLSSLIINSSSCYSQFELRFNRMYIKSRFRSLFHEMHYHSFVLNRKIIDPRGWTFSLWFTSKELSRAIIYWDGGIEILHFALCIIRVLIVLVASVASIRTWSNLFSNQRYSKRQYLLKFVKNGHY